MTPLVGLDYGGASAAIVHQNRLVLAGSGGIPDLLLASRTGVWHDFRLGRWSWTTTVTDPDGSTRDVRRTRIILDPERRPTPETDGFPTDPELVTEGTLISPAEGFYVSQASGRGSRFHALLQQEGLFVLGDVGESVVPPDRAFTSETIEVRENSWFGSDLGRTPVIAGGLVIFVQAGGEDVRGIAWTEAQRKYLAQSMLSVAGDVFGRAVDMTFQPSTGRNGDTVYAIGEDGRMGVMLLSVGAPYPAWSTWETAGKPYENPVTGEVTPTTDRFVGGAAPLGVACWLVERDGEVQLEVEEEDAPCADGGPFDADSPPPEGAPIYEKVDGRWLEWTPDGARPRPTSGWWGWPWVAEAETLPWIAQKRTGLQRSVRRVRCLDVNLDVVDPRGRVLAERARELAQRTQEEAQRIAATVHSDLQRITVVTVSERRDRVRRPRRSRSSSYQDTDLLIRLRYGDTPGWRTRLALRIECPVPCTIAGLSYRVVA